MTDLSAVCGLFLSALSGPSLYVNDETSGNDELKKMSKLVKEKNKERKKKITLF